MGSERVKLSEGAVILLVTMRVINISESSFRPQHGQFEWLAPTRSPRLRKREDNTDSSCRIL